MPPRPATTVHASSRLPRGAVGLLHDALAERWSAPVAVLRTLHLAWLLRTVGSDRRRVVTAHAPDGALLGVAVSLRYDARASLRHLLAVTAVALTIGGALGLTTAALSLPVWLVTAALGCLVGNLVAGAVAADGRDGLVGARRARRHAEQFGSTAAWGRGLVAVDAAARGHGLGRRLVRDLVLSLPEEHVWLPVATSTAAEHLYRDLGARPIGGRASRLTGAEVARAA